MRSAELQSAVARQQSRRGARERARESISRARYRSAWEGGGKFHRLLHYMYDSASCISFLGRLLYVRPVPSIEHAGANTLRRDSVMIGRRT